MQRELFGVLVVVVLTCSLAQAQVLQVNRENRTISVSVTESVKVDPEVARVHVGYSNYGPTQEQVFQENVVAANRISEAIINAGVPKENLETEEVMLAPVYQEDWPEQWKKERKYQARQLWTIVVPVEQAQTVVDVAAAAGANEIEDVTWGVKDEEALQAGAYSAALARAHSLAGQMAKELNAKVGELLYASNTRPITGPFFWAGGASMAAVMVAAQREPQLKLFPQKVEQEATVYAVFAIE